MSEATGLRDITQAHEREPQPGDVVVPGELFAALMGLVESMPYGQVAGLVDAVRERAWPVE